MEEQTITVGAHRQQKVRDLDFRRPMKFTRDQLRVLERAQEAFCRAASGRLSAELRADAVVTFTGSDQLAYGAIMAEELPQQSLVIMMEAQPIMSSMLLVLEKDTVLSLVDRSLGGSFQADTTRDELTEIEITVATNALSGLIEAMSAAWEDLCGVTFEAKDTETSPIAVQIVPPSEPSLILGFSLQLNDHQGVMAMVVPWSSIAPVIEQISRSREASVGEGAPAARALSRARVTVSAEAGSRQMAVSELLEVKEGEVLEMPQLESDGVTLLVEGKELYRAQHGSNQGQRAAQVSQRID